MADLSLESATPRSAQPSPPSLTPEPTPTPAPAPAPEPAAALKPAKPLSKLQLKMQAAAAAKKAAASAPPPADKPKPTATPAPAPEPEPAPPPAPSLLAPPSLFASALSHAIAKPTGPSPDEVRAKAARELEARLLASSSSFGRAGSAFAGPSPDDVVFEKRKGTALGTNGKVPVRR